MFPIDKLPALWDASPFVAITAIMLWVMWVNRQPPHRPKPESKSEEFSAEQQLFLRDLADRIIDRIVERVTDKRD